MIDVGAVGPLVRVRAPRDVGVTGAELDRLHVDASSFCAPILRRLGFQQVTTSRQFGWGL